MLAKGVWSALNVMAVTFFMIAVVWRMYQGEILTAGFYVGILILYLLSHCLIQLIEIKDLLRAGK